MCSLPAHRDVLARRALRLAAACVAALLVACDDEPAPPMDVGRALPDDAERSLVQVAPIDASTDLPAWNERIWAAVAARATRFDGGVAEDFDYTECAAVNEIARTYLCVSDDIVSMNRALLRASMFVEHRVFRGQVVSITSDEYRGRLSFIEGLDLRSEDLLAFWSLAQQACADDSAMCGSEAERVMFEEWIVPIASREASFVVVTYAFGGTLGWPATASHELLHAQYFQQDVYRATVDQFWDVQMSDEDRQEARRLLSDVYDLSNDFLVRNEFQAYLLELGSSRPFGRFASLVPIHRQALTDALQDAGVPPIQIAFDRY